MNSWPFYDPEPVAVIEPSERIPPVPGFPRLVVSTFSKKIIDHFVAASGAGQVAEIIATGGPIPIYATQYEDQAVAFYQCPVGAPVAVGSMEEIIAFGGRCFVYFGSCGALDGRLTEGHFILPTAAIRDEGISRHYLPPADEIELEPAVVDAMAATFEALGIPFVTCKTWTTDAFYRETPRKVAEAKARGCAVVEMECASLAAVARFRGVTHGQFLYTADNLDAPAWQARDLREHGLTHADRYMAAAMACALRLGGLGGLGGSK